MPRRGRAGGTVLLSPLSGAHEAQAVRRGQLCRARCRGTPARDRPRAAPDSSQRRGPRSASFAQAPPCSSSLTSAIVSPVARLRRRLRQKCSPLRRRPPRRRNCSPDRRERLVVGARRVRSGDRGPGPDLARAALAIALGGFTVVVLPAPLGSQQAEPHGAETVKDSPRTASMRPVGLAQVFHLGMATSGR